MTEIKSKEVTVKGTTQEVFDFLIDLNNFQQLLPQDKISDWESTNDSCAFKVQHAATIELIKDSSEAPEKIHLVSGSRSPFPFTLDIHLSSNGDNQCDGYLLFQGKMNPFIKMVAEKPLRNLFDYISFKLKEVRAQS